MLNPPKLVSSPLIMPRRNLSYALHPHNPHMMPSVFTNTGLGRGGGVPEDDVGVLEEGGAAEGPEGGNVGSEAGGDGGAFTWSERQRTKREISQARGAPCRTYTCTCCNSSSGGASWYFSTSSVIFALPTIPSKETASSKRPSQATPQRQRGFTFLG